MKYVMSLITALLISISSPVFAMDLQQAKAQGFVGEQPNGYLGVVKATPEAINLANDINERRRAAYEKIARDNGTSLDQVAALTGQTAIEKSAPGTWIKTPEGQWIKK
ncbi:MAG: YdbL family protein [Moraxellaceae bacterium]|nr:YdbL family protein [Moraxellaceae bacterium]